MTVANIAEQLGMLPDTVKRRIQRRKIKPVRYIGPTSLSENYFLNILYLFKSRF
jgi:IS30 family transposase